ncbi:unnamed protein product [Prunus armeniaca]
MKSWLRAFRDHDGDLYNVALGFRLLRQHGYKVSCDVFNKFKDENGSFKECLIADVPGMLSLYEAGHLGVRGEEILDEALAFTTTHLDSAAKAHVSYQHEEKITQALERPLQKDLERVCARRYTSIYRDEASHSEALLKLAKLDFNLVQSLHKKELSEITRWWKEVDFERKLPFGRDRIVESYFWAMAVYFEPHYSAGRKLLSKSLALVTVMDDMYDAFGTFDELEIFTEAIGRWDVNCMDELPDYMQIFYQTFLNFLIEIEEEMVKKGNSYRVYYAKEAWKATARAYFDEARWLHEGCIPSMEEYMHVATASIASNIIFRLMDDIAGYKFDKERGHVACSIDCYMKQHGVSEQETLDVFNKQVVDLWKDINEELLIKPTVVPRPVLMRVLNLTRVVDLLYKRGDGFTHVGKHMKDIVASLFLDPVPL